MFAPALVAGLLAMTPTASAQKTAEKAKAAAESKAPAKAPAAAAKEVPMAERCIGKTQDGDQCKRKSADGSKYCWQHDPNRKAKKAKKAA